MVDAVTPPAPAKLKLSLSELGTGSISLNGIDLSDYVTAIEFECKCGSETKVKLTIITDVDADVSARLDRIGIVKTGEPKGVRLLDGRTITPRQRPAK